MTTQLVYMNIGIVIATVLALIYFVGKEKLKVSGQLESTRKRKAHNKYVRYTNNIFLRKRFRRIVEKFSTLSCYDFETVQMKSVQLFEQTTIVAVLMPVVTLITMRDVLITVLVAFVGYIYYDVTVDKAIDRVYFEIMHEISSCIQSIRERYMETDNIPLAILYSDKGKFLDRPINQIYDILTAVDGEERLYEFCRLSPIRMIRTLATTCYVVNEVGDEKGPNGSVFAEEMTMLRQEVDAEIRRLTKVRIAFKSLSALTLGGLICSPLAEWFLLSQIPGTSILLKGFYGLFCKMLLVFMTIGAYYVISIMNRPSVVNQVDKMEWIDRISHNTRVQKFIKNIIPKKYKKRYVLNRAIADSISSKDLEYIYTSKCIFSIIAFVVMLVFLSLFVFTAKSNLYSNYKSLSFIPSAAIEERTYKQLVKMDNEYMALPEVLNNEDTLKFVKGRVRGLRELEYMKEQERIILKYTKYHQLEFKFWFVLLAYAAAVGAWHGPELSLKLRKWLVEYESVEDILQLQTMMIVLSNTKMDVHKAIYWLEKQSTIHKAPLRFAYHEYTSNPELALERLKDSVHSRDFKRLISKLHTAIYNLSLQDAFSDMILDKQQSLSLREMLQGEALESKKQWAKLIAILPLAICLIFLFVAPILILGVSELLKTFGALQGGI